jgi:hypothetical protein
MQKDANENLLDWQLSSAPSPRFARQGKAFWKVSKFEQTSAVRI